MTSFSGGTRRRLSGRPGHQDEVESSKGASPNRRSTYARTRLGYRQCRLSEHNHASSSGTGRTSFAARLGKNQKIQFALQEPQLGTAHALQQAEPLLAGRAGSLILLSGDVPLLSPNTLKRLLETHRGSGAAATVVTATVERPYGYGRIVRTRGRIARIVEERDASPTQRQIKEINSGIYAFDLAPLFGALRSIASQNAQGEFYLTDLIAIYRRKKLPVETLLIENAQEIRGINSRSELAEVSRLVRQKKNEELMAAGVTFIDPATTYVDPEAEIAADTVLHPGVVIEGRTTNRGGL